MPTESSLTRRRFLKTAAVGTVAAQLAGPFDRPAQAAMCEGRRVPLKIGIRAASMQMVGDFSVVRTAAGIPGIMGVELQTTSGSPNLRDWDAVRRYKKEADRWGIHIPSLAERVGPGRADSQPLEPATAW